jgi:hypothetical protein
MIQSDFRLPYDPINCNCIKYGAIVAAARWNRVSKAQTSDRIQHDVLRWGFELPRRLPRRLLCSGMACLIVWCHCTYFSEECTASIFTAEEYAMPSSAVSKCVALWDLLQRWRTKQRAPPSSWCVVACVHGVTSQKTVYVFRYTHSDWRVTYQWWTLLLFVFRAWKYRFVLRYRTRRSGNWTSRGKSLCLGGIRSHSGLSTVCAVSAANKTAGFLLSVNRGPLCVIFAIQCCVNRSRSSLLGNYQVVSFSHYIKH